MLCYMKYSCIKLVSMETFSCKTIQAKSIQYAIYLCFHKREKSKMKYYVMEKNIN